MGPPATPSARSTTSVGPPTPPQRPRGPARTISSRIGPAPVGSDMLISPGSPAGEADPQYRDRSRATQGAGSREEIAHADDEQARVDPQVLVAGAGVRDVLEP